MAGHDYWRVSFLDSQHGGYPASADIQFRPVAGVSVTPSGGTPFISAILFGSPIDVFDGNPATGIVLNGYSGWMEYQYAPGTGPACVELMLQAHRDYYHNEGPKNISVDYSDDGATWTTLKLIECGCDWFSDEVREFPLGAPPPGPYASQFALVVPAQVSVTPYANQYAIVLPAADLPIPTVGAQVSQFAIVSVGYEYDMKPEPHGYSIHQLWGFPLLIQTGV